jgi:hypothetical protein
MKDRMAETIRSKLSPNRKGYIYVENGNDKSNQLSTAKEARMPDPILSADEDDVLSIEKLLPKLGISIDDLRTKMIKQKDSMDMKPPPIENIASRTWINDWGFYTIQFIGNASFYCINNTNNDTTPHSKCYSSSSISSCQCGFCCFL